MYKSVLYLMLLILSTVIMVGCQSDLDQVPLSSETAENFYQTAGDFEQARNSVYATGLKNYPTYLMELNETRSDIIYTVPQVSFDWEGIHDFRSSISSNGTLKSAYTNSFNAIYKANQLIFEIDKDLESGDVFSKVESAEIMKAEAQFIRAFSYFALVRWFGKVPLIKEVVTPQEAAEIGRASIEDIYDFVLSDLKESIETLPEEYENEGEEDSQYGRITKFGAKSILALVYMTRSSPDYGIEGPGLGLDEWDLAYKELDDIVNSGIYYFEEDYSTIFRMEGSSNGENVFVIPFEEDTGNGVGSNFMAEHIGSDAFFASLGLSDQGASEGRFVSSVFRNKFEMGDVRAAFGIADEYTVDSGRWIGSYNDPVISKYADISRYGNGRTDWGVDFIAMRYTDVLILRAECTLHGGGGTQNDVDDVVNNVRERAGLKRDAKNITLDELFEEKQKEFFGEGRRWFDLFRSGKAVEIMNKWKEDQDRDGIIQDISENSLIYPIPLEELLNNPGLYEQNPGY